jgi:hypothetical protein
VYHLISSHPGLPELKAKLKGNDDDDDDDDASPCFELFSIGKMSDKFLPTQTLP